MEYQKFIESKPRDFRPTGFEVSPIELNDNLFGYQEEIGRAIGIELKAEYFEQAIRNCECAVSESMQVDFLGANN